MSKRRWVVRGLAAAVLITIACGWWLTRQPQPGGASRLYCGPDGQLTTTAPIQSHRSYCLRAYTKERELRLGVPADFVFDIIDDRGQPLREFATVHEKQMHVIVVRRDLTHFQHLHPVFAENGRFTVRSLVLPTDGPYRLFADFTPVSGQWGPGGEPLAVTVPVDLEAGDVGRYRPEALPDPVDSVAVGDYVVLLAKPDTLRAGEEARLTFTIRLGGAAVSGLEPYLGANGHAVVLREGDLAFLHSHALEDPAALRAGELPFMVHFAEPGRYRMFVQFQHRGAVQTAAFTLSPVVSTGAARGGGHSMH